MIAKELTLTRNKSKASEVFGHGGKNPFLFVLYLFCCVMSVHFHDPRAACISEVEWVKLECHAKPKNRVC